jgi:hypothetical protein
VLTLVFTEWRVFDRSASVRLTKVRAIKERRHQNRSAKTRQLSVPSAGSPEPGTPQSSSRKFLCYAPAKARLARGASSSTAHCPQKIYGLRITRKGPRKLEGIMHACPRCASLNTRRSKRKVLEKFLALLFVRPYRCRDCNNRFFNGMTKLRLRSSDLHRVGT